MSHNTVTTDLQAIVALERRVAEIAGMMRSQDYEKGTPEDELLQRLLVNHGELQSLISQLHKRRGSSENARNAHRKCFKELWRRSLCLVPGRSQWASFWMS